VTMERPEKGSSPKVLARPDIGRRRHAHDPAHPDSARRRHVPAHPDCGPAPVGDHRVPTPISEPIGASTSGAPNSAGLRPLSAVAHRPRPDSERRGCARHARR